MNLFLKIVVNFNRQLHLLKVPSQMSDCALNASLLSVRQYINFTRSKTYIQFNHFITLAQFPHKEPLINYLNIFHSFQDMITGSRVFFNSLTIVQKDIVWMLSSFLAVLCNALKKIK